MTEALIDVAAFDRVSPAAAVELLRPVCASVAWLEAVAAGRPYGTLAEVITTSDALVAAMSWPGVEEALAAHPRIGERPTGNDREATLSRQEQSSTTGADADISAKLRAGNLAYEQRFGHVYLVCATGRTPQQLLAALHERLDNDAATEQAVVRRELAAIVRLRLEKTLQ